MRVRFRMSYRLGHNLYDRGAIITPGDGVAAELVRRGICELIDEPVVEAHLPLPIMPEVRQPAGIQASTKVVAPWSRRRGRH